jgi:hypothetical protein
MSIARARLLAYPQHTRFAVAAPTDVFGEAYDASADVAASMTAFVPRVYADLANTEAAITALKQSLSTSDLKDRYPFVSDALINFGEVKARYTAYDPVTKWATSPTPPQLGADGAFSYSTYDLLSAMLALTVSGVEPMPGSDPTSKGYAGNYIPLLTNALANLNYDRDKYTAWLAPFASATSADERRAAEEQALHDAQAALDDPQSQDTYGGGGGGGGGDGDGGGGGGGGRDGGRRGGGDGGVTQALRDKLAREAQAAQDAKDAQSQDTDGGGNDGGGNDTEKDGTSTSAAEGASRGGVALVAMVGVAALALWGVSKMTGGSSART